MTPEEINAKALQLAMKHFLRKFEYKESELKEDESMLEGQLKAIKWTAKHYQEFIADTSWAKKEEEKETPKDCIRRCKTCGGSLLYGNMTWVFGGQCFDCHLSELRRVRFESA